MSDVVIKAEGISKSYLIGHQSNKRYVALRDVIVNNSKGLWSNIFNPQSHVHKNIEEFWALKDISFEVKKGDCIGIIGRNGVGKSTLLKILSRITERTKGKLSIKGRVASLLEVGTGFHPELTGRENIYLNGAILGMTRQDINRKFDEIIAFAEVEKFLDTPVKHFSNGMYLRLAFAVAAHLDPEILVIDEVLAVGDASFQKKCLGKMDNVAKEGRTILFVSHNMGAIEAFCQKCMWIDSGTINLLSNNVNDTVNKYIQSTVGDKKTTSSAWKFQNEYFEIITLKLYREGEEVPSTVFSKSDKIVIEIIIDVLCKESALDIGYALYKSDNNTCLWWSFYSDSEEETIKPGRNSFRSSINPGILNDGTYRLEIIAGLQNLDWIIKPGQFMATLEFIVEGGAIGSIRSSSDTRPGLLFPILKWNIKHI